MDSRVATASLCFSGCSSTLGDTFASISSRSPFTRLASATHRATSRRFNCPSANLSHLRKSLRQTRASSPRAYVPSSPIPPSCTRVSGFRILALNSTTTHSSNETVDVSTDLGVHGIFCPVVQRGLGHCDGCRPAARCPAISTRLAHASLNLKCGVDPPTTRG